MRRPIVKTAIEAVAVLASIALFWVPLYFIIVNALKDPAGASEFSLKWPDEILFWENLATVISTRDYMLLRAFFNSIAITVLSIVVMIVVCSMVGFVLQRRRDKATPWVTFFVLAGMIIPPAIVPTIWVLENLYLFKKLAGIVAVEIALGFPFGTILYRNFIAGIPREIDEAAIIDGCGKYRLFFNIILPLLKPVTATIIVTSSVTIFNDFVNPLYFFPGAKNVTVQLTLYNFMSQFLTQYNLLFMNILVITIPPLILFLFFNNKIVAGMTAGSVKG